MLVCPACRLVLSASFCGVHGVEGDPAELDALHAALSGKFRVSGAYAVGDTGTLYVAEELATKRQGLLKILRVRDDAGRDALERLVTEIQNQTVLSHSSFLVPVRRAGLDDGVPWVFRDFVPGESLKSRLARTGKMSLSDALVVAAQMATALHDLHSRGLVHRALRPGHVLLRDDTTGTEHALVIEAGMAGRNDRTSPLEDLGDLFYMPPEVARGEKVGFRSDLYALGCTLYDALVGAPPFDGESADEVVNGHLYTAPWVPRDTLPAQIASLLEQLLAKAPFDRPSSAKEVIRELEPYLPPDWQMPPHETAKSAQAIAVAVPAARVSAPPPVPALRASAMPPPTPSAMPPRASTMPAPPSAMPPRASTMPPPAPSAMPPRASTMPPRATTMPPPAPPRPSAMRPAETVPAKILGAASLAPDSMEPIPLDAARAKKPTPWPAPRPSASSPELPPPAPLPFESDHDISSIMPTEIDVTDDFPPVRAGRRFPRGTAGFVLGCAATMAATWALAYTGNFHVVTDTLTTHLAVPESNLENGVHAASASLAATASTAALTATAPAASPAPAPAAETEAPATETAAATDTEPATDTGAATDTEAAAAAATETAPTTETGAAEANAGGEAETEALATDTAASDGSARTEPAERPRRMTRAERLRALRQARIERRREIREARLERRRQRIRARVRAQRREAAREARAAHAGSESSSRRSGGSVDDFLL